VRVDSDQAVLLQIGEVAENVGLSLRTVRYYEEVGLVTPASRSEGGFRLYSDADVERLRLLKRMKPLGLSLEEMRELADLIERSELPAGLSKRDLRTLVDALRSYAARADAAIETLERQLGEARQLRLRIGDRLGRFDATLEQSAARR
jgi:MerR family copper efflux transcriptional regulator